MEIILSVLIMLSFIISSAYSEDLKRLNMDDATAIATTIQTDTRVKTEGSGSIKISTQWPITICLGQLTRVNVENLNLVYNAKAKRDIDGTAYLEMWVHVGRSQYFSRGINDVEARRTIGK